MPAKRAFSPAAIKRTLKEFSKHQYDSECVNSLSFIPTTQLSGDLTVVFQRRGSYVYHEFPVDEWLLFNNASSRGTYFNTYVRDHGYSYERVG